MVQGFQVVGFWTFLTLYNVIRIPQWSSGSSLPTPSITELLCTRVAGCVLCSYEPAALYWQALQGEFIMNMWPIWSCLALRGKKRRNEGEKERQRK